MKDRILKSLLGISAVVALLAGSVSASAASSIIIASGFIHDPSGKPVAGVRVLIESTDTTSGQYLSVTAVSDSKGKFYFQSYEDYKVTFSPDAADKCLNSSATPTGSVTPSKKVIDLTVPAERRLNFNVKTESGSPIAGVQLGVVRRSFTGGFSCQSQVGGRTDELGNLTHSTFVGAGSNPDSYPGAVAVYFNPFEGVQLMKWVLESELTDNPISVVLDEVPSVVITSPSVASSSGFDISAKVLNPDGSVATSPADISPASFKAAALRFQYKQVELYKRSLVKGKWAAWVKHSTRSVASNGVVKFTKVKLSKGSNQIRLAGVRFSLGSKPKTIQVK